MKNKILLIVLSSYNSAQLLLMSKSRIKSNYIHWNFKSALWDVLSCEQRPPEAYLCVAHITILFDPPWLKTAIGQTLQTFVLSQAAADEAFPRSCQWGERFMTMTLHLCNQHFLKIKSLMNSNQCVRSLPLYTRSVMSSSVEGMI